MAAKGLDDLPGNCRNQGNNNGISTLAIGLDVRHFRQKIGVGVSHQPGAFAGGQSPGIFPRSLGNENFRPVFVVAGAQSSGHAIKVNQPEAKTIAFLLVVARIVLEVLP